MVARELNQVFKNIFRKFVSNVDAILLGAAVEHFDFSIVQVIYNFKEVNKQLPSKSIFHLSKVSNYHEI